MFKKTDIHNNENISDCQKCVQSNFEVLSLHFDEHNYNIQTLSPGEKYALQIKTNDLEEVSCDNGSNEHKTIDLNFEEEIEKKVDSSTLSDETLTMNSKNFIPVINCHNNDYTDQTCFDDKLNTTPMNTVMNLKIKMKLLKIKK